MSAQKRREQERYTGIARALIEADPDTPVDELGTLLEDVPTWECCDCGDQRYTNPRTCTECGSQQFQKVGDDDD